MTRGMAGAFDAAESSLNSYISITGQFVNILVQAVVKRT
jgi:hypothetical protein